MDEAENEAYHALPEMVTVYRGCDANSPKVLCWSLDERTTNSFPFATRFRAAMPVVIRARAKKDRILAVKLDRGENEVITFSPRTMSIKLADELGAKAEFEARHAAQQPWIALAMEQHAELLASGASFEAAINA